MGWTFTVKPSWKTTREFLRGKLNCSNEHGSWEVLDDALVARTEYYAAIRRTHTDGTAPYVFGAVFLVRHVPRARDGYTFGYKDMDESMGPNADRCPLRILDLLSPTDEKYAIEWRERCRRYHDRQKRKLELLQRVEFTDPIHFSGIKEKVFTYQGRNVFAPVNHFIRVRIPGWKQLDYREL